MSFFYLIPAALLWLAYGASRLSSAPWWVDYPLFGAACVATTVGALMKFLIDGWSRR